jgi:hypothetical protein
VEGAESADGWGFVCVCGNFDAPSAASVAVGFWQRGCLGC